MSGHELVTGPGVGGRATGHHIDAVRVAREGRGVTGHHVNYLGFGMKPMVIPSYVYAHEAWDGSTLYVGCSQRPRERQYEHACRADWWPLVHTVRILEVFNTEAEALDAERRHIAVLQPPYNVLDHPRAVVLVDVSARGMRPGDRCLIGAALRSIRHAQRMKLEDLATAAEVSVGYLSKIERGLRRPTLGTIDRLAAALDVDRDAISFVVPAAEQVSA